jgi:colicin import membrane protein
MRASLRRPAVLAAATLTAVLTLTSLALAADGDEIGRLIAEQFAKEGSESLPAGAARTVVPAQAPGAADEQRMIEEIEMLERARAEAEARRDALVKAREAAEQGESPKADAADKAKEEQRRAEERRLAEEAEHAVEAARKAEAAALARMEAEREAEADRIDAALRKAREARAQRPREEREREALVEGAASERRQAEIPEVHDSRGGRDAGDRTASWPRPRLTDGASGLGGPHAPSPSASARVTVLLTMLPGNRGIRRHNKTGDPILCSERGCYVSAGADAPADLMPLRRAFGIGRTLGERAGACRQSLGCVFRRVDLVAFPAILQPVDMRLLKHDRRQPQVLHEASACRLAAGRLACTAVHGPDYTMWIVPEEIAAAAGPEALEQAVEGGLVTPEPRVLVHN